MQIEKNIPIPTGKYPFPDMSVNDSFAVPKGVKRTAIGVSALRYGRKHGMKFTIRQMPDKTLRCWRVA